MSTLLPASGFAAAVTMTASSGMRTWSRKGAFSCPTNAERGCASSSQAMGERKALGAGDSEEKATPRSREAKFA